MESIPKFLASLITIMIAVLVCVSFVISSVLVNAARTYHASVIETIEASDFDEDTIQNCIDASEKSNYFLSVEKLSLPETASDEFYKITLNYNLLAPVFGNIHKGTIVGYAGFGAQLSE